MSRGLGDVYKRQILDYNQMFHTNYDTSSDKFQNYYKDVSLRMKNKELDLLNSTSYQNKAAEGIYNAINEAFQEGY